MAQALRWLVLSWLVSAAPSFSQTCPTPEGVAAGRSDAARLKFLKAELLAESHRARNWTMAWGATYGLLTLGQIAGAPLIAPQDQVEWWVGAASSAVGFAFTVLDPLEVIEAGPDYAARAAAPADVCALIAEGEGLLARNAAHERLGTRWFIHVANVALNIGFGLILGLGYGHWVAAAINTAAGIAVGELTLFTSPTRLIAAQSEYQRGELGADAPPVAFRVFPIVQPHGAGLGFAVRF